MDNLQGADSLKWIDRFARTLDSIRSSADRKQFLADLVDGAVQVSRAARAHSILMEGDTVVAEAGYTSSGDSFEAPVDARKAAARVTLNAIKRHRQDGGGMHGFEMADGSAQITFIVKDGVGGSVFLEQVEASKDGGRNIGLTVALILAAARILGSNEAQALAADRAEKAETRTSEIEAAVASGGVGAVAYLKQVSELERDAIELALRTTNWNKEEAARRLGISRASIYMKVKKFGLQKPPA